jgi:hypothetical protein
MYIGDKKIKENSTGPDGWENVVFEDGSTLRLPKRMYDNAISVKPEDPTTHRDRRVMPVVSELVALLMMWDIKISEVDYLFGLTSNFLNEKLEHAGAKVWKKQLTERTIGDVNDVLENKNGYGDKV